MNARTMWVDVTRCTGCGVCVRACPAGAIALADGKAHIDEELCTGCEACVSACPEDAIQPVVQGELIPTPARPVPTAYRPGPLAETAGAAVVVTGVGLLAKAAGALADAAVHGDQAACREWVTCDCRRRQHRARASGAAPPARPAV